MNAKVIMFFTVGLPAVLPLIGIMVSEQLWLEARGRLVGKDNLVPGGRFTTLFYRVVNWTR
jgi:hypothetical protein